MTGTQVCELNAFVHPVQTQHLADNYNGTNLQQHCRPRLNLLPTTVVVNEGLQSKRMRRSHQGCYKLCDDGLAGHPKEYRQRKQCRHTPYGRRHQCSHYNAVPVGVKGLCIKLANAENNILLQLEL